MEVQEDRHGSAERSRLKTEFMPKQAYLLYKYKWVSLLLRTFSIYTYQFTE